MNTNKCVLLGMSGGTDSSVAAMLLQDAGYEVVGVTFRFFEKEGDTRYLDEARELAQRLGMRHITYDARRAFHDNIIRYFIDEYMSARTPVPCVLCNNTLKWPLLAEIANQNNIHHIATGHYVRKVLVDGKYYITPARDPDKDQSFFLWGLGQDILHRMLLPMGDVLKTDARRLAAARGFARVAEKKDSIGVCFCPFDYHTFLRQHVDPDRFKQGAFVDENGKFIAHHQGYPFYTIGQRRGLGIHLNRPVFVKDINPHTNKITLAPLQALEKNEFVLTRWNAIDTTRLFNDPDVIVKIRYRKQANHCTVTLTPQNQLHVALHEPLAAIAPGQAAAFYKDGLLLGGGIIV